MKIKLLIIPAIFIFFLSNCSKNDGDGKKISLNSSEQATVNACNSFALQLLQRVNNAEHIDSNYCFSPFNLSVGLALAYNGAEGNTKTAMAEIVQFNSLSLNDINNAYKKLKNSFTELDKYVKVSISNAILYKSASDINQTFIDLGQDFYYSEVRPIDFGSSLAVTEINRWFAESTGYYLTTIVSSVAANNVLYGINGLYFDGAWKYKIDPFFTADSVFFLADGSEVEVQTMLQKNPFNYYENDRMRVTELPFGEGNYTMLILLPKAGQTTNDIIGQMSDEYWKTIVDGLEMKNNLQIWLPKFQIIYEKSLNEILSQMGLESMFAADANFSLMGNGSLNFTQYQHKTYISLDEDGIRTSGVPTYNNPTSEAGGSLFDYFPFVVNKPFIFAIRELDTKAIIYLGKVVNPALNK